MWNLAQAHERHIEPELLHVFGNLLSHFEAARVLDDPTDAAAAKRRQAETSSIIASLSKIRTSPDSSTREEWLSIVSRIILVLLRDMEPVDRPYPGMLGLDAGHMAVIVFRECNYELAEILYDFGSRDEEFGDLGMLYDGPAHLRMRESPDALADIITHHTPYNLDHVDAVISTFNNFIGVKRSPAALAILLDRLRAHDGAAFPKILLIPEIVNALLCSMEKTPILRASFHALCTH